MADEKIKVSVDEELCIGCQHCVEVCPEVFKYNADKGVAEAGEVPADCKCDLEQVAADCAGGAISVEKE